MIRITEQSNGVLHVMFEDGNSQYVRYDDLEPGAKEKFDMLHAVDIGVRVAGIGLRSSPSTFWIEEYPEDHAGQDRLTYRGTNNVFGNLLYNDLRRGRIFR